MSKRSVRFFNDREVRAVWDEAQNAWRFAVLDIIGVLNEDPIIPRRVTTGNT